MHSTHPRTILRRINPLHLPQGTGAEEWCFPLQQLCLGRSVRHEPPGTATDLTSCRTPPASIPWLLTASCWKMALAWWGQPPTRGGLRRAYSTWNRVQTTLWQDVRLTTTWFDLSGALFGANQTCVRGETAPRHSHEPNIRSNLQMCSFSRLLKGWVVAAIAPDLVCTASTAEQKKMQQNLHYPECHLLQITSKT